MSQPGREITEEYMKFLGCREFPCIAAKAALSRQQVKCMVAGNIACPHNDAEILQFLYDFVDVYRSSKDFYHSAAVIFTGPEINNEEMFDALLWQRLQALEVLDAK